MELLEFILNAINLCLWLIVGYVLTKQKQLIFLQKTQIDLYEDFFALPFVKNNWNPFEGRPQKEETREEK